MNVNKLTNVLTTAVTLLVAAIGAGAFVLSYDALYATGQQHGTFAAGKLWIFPLIVDGPLVVFTLALLVAQITRQSVKLWAGLVILFTLLTVGFNLSHAQATPLGWLVAIVAPVGLLLTTEALRHLAKTIIERAAAVATLAELLGQADRARSELAEILSHKQGESDRLNGQIEQAAAKLESLRAEIKATKDQQNAASIAQLNARRLALIEQRRAKILILLGQGMAPPAIAAEVGASLSTIKRDLTALNGAAALARGMQ